jgi:hypothetical protein
MVRNDGVEVRRQRIQETLRRVQSLLYQNKGKIPLGKTVATLQYEIGLTSTKVMEYIGIEKSLGQFVVDEKGDQIRSTDSKEKNQDVGGNDGARE